MSLPKVNVRGSVNIKGLDPKSAVANSQYEAWQAEAVKRGSELANAMVLDEVLEIYPHLTAPAAYARLSSALDLAEGHRIELGLPTKGTLDFKHIGRLDAAKPISERLSMSTSTAPPPPPPSPEDDGPPPDPTEVYALLEAFSEPLPEADPLADAMFGPAPPTSAAPYVFQPGPRAPPSDTSPPPAVSQSALHQATYDGLIVGLALGVGAALAYFYFIRPALGSVLSSPPEIAVPPSP